MPALKADKASKVVAVCFDGFGGHAALIAQVGEKGGKEIHA
jgi:hypothetical protein